MERLHRYSIAHPIRVLILATLVTAAIAPGALRLRLRTDGQALVPRGAPAVRFDHAIREEFGLRDVLVVLIRSDHPDGIFNPHTLERVSELTTDLQSIEGVEAEHLVSLANERSSRVWPGTLNFRPFLDPPPRTRAQAERVRADLEKVRIYTGTLVSYDGTATAILIGVPPEVDRVRLCAAVDERISNKERPGEEVHLLGAPVAEALLGSHILDDLGLPDRLLGHRPGRTDPSGRFPRSFYELRVWVGGHVGLVPLAIAIMALVFLIAFRSLAAVALPMLEVAAALVAVFGLMGWFNVPVYLTIAVLPVILTAIALADEIHIFTRYAQRRAEQPGEHPVQSVSIAMGEMWRPVVKTSLTTAVGFLSFALSPITPVRAFGIFMAVGILFCMLWSLTVIPAQLVLLKPGGFRAPPGAHAAPAAGTRAFTRLGAAVARRPKRVLAVAALLLAITPLGIARIVVQDSWIDGFAEDSEFRQATGFFNDQFLGTHALVVMLDTGHLSISGDILGREVDHREVILPRDAIADPAGLIGCAIGLRRGVESSGGAVPNPRTTAATWSSIIESVERAGDHLRVGIPRHHRSPLHALRNPAPGETLRFEIASHRLLLPEVLRRIEAFEGFAGSRREYTVGGTLGPARYLATTNFIVRNQREEARRIPDSPDEVEWVWKHYRRVRGVDRLHEVVDERYERTLVTLFLKDANFVDTRRLMDAIRDYERAHLAPHDIRLTFAGDVAVSQTLIEGIVTTQIRSLLFSILGILAAAMLFHRSLRLGAFSVIPCAVAVAVNFAIMGWTSMPLGVATSMFAGMILGIGVDYAIHLVERYRIAAARGLASGAALAETLSITGPAIVIDGIAVALGFGVLTLSQVPANARLGGLTVVCIASCLAATLLLIPALLTVSRPGSAAATDPS